MTPAPRARLVALLLAVALAIPSAPALAADGGPSAVPALQALPAPDDDDYDYEPPAPGSYRLPVIGPAPDGRVLDSDGRERALHDVMDGRVTLLSFIYTRCADPEGCPLATATLYDIYYASERDPALASALRLVSLSFDPAHDTPEVMRGFAVPETGAKSRARADWAFLTTENEAELRPILKGYQQVIREKRDAEGNTAGKYAHQLRVYLIDRQKRIRNIYGLAFLDPRLLVTDIHTLLMEERAARR